MTGFAIDSPRYLDPAQDADSLLRMILELTSEVWVLRDRLILVERALDEKGTLVRADLDGAEPDAATVAELAAGRSQFINRVLGAARRHDS